MPQSLQLLEQAERCRRLARDSTDGSVRDGLLTLVYQYIARAAALEERQSPTQKPVRTIKIPDGAQSSGSMLPQRRDIVGHAPTTYQPAALAVVR